MDWQHKKKIYILSFSPQISSFIPRLPQSKAIYRRQCDLTVIENENKLGTKVAAKKERVNLTRARRGGGVFVQAILRYNIQYTT